MENDVDYEEFPKYWKLRITEENLDVVNNWRINIIKYSNSPINEAYSFIYDDGGGTGWGPAGRGRVPEISYLDFLKYVLKQEESISIEDDLTHLVILLNKINNE